MTNQYLEEKVFELEKRVEKIELSKIISDLPSINEPCDDAISRDAVLNAICDYVALEEYEDKSHTFTIRPLEKRIDELPSVTQKLGKCKNCKYFEYDSVAKVDGIPLIVAHEICNKWGDGCKTKEDGYCYLFEPQESEKVNCKSIKCDNCINHNYCDYEPQESEE